MPFSTHLLAERRLAARTRTTRSAASVRLVRRRRVRRKPSFGCPRPHPPARGRAPESAGWRPFQDDRGWRSGRRARRDKLSGRHGRGPAGVEVERGKTACPRLGPRAAIGRWPRGGARRRRGEVRRGHCFGRMDRSEQPLATRPRRARALPARRRGAGLTRASSRGRRPGSASDGDRVGPGRAPARTTHGDGRRVWPRAAGLTTSRVATKGAALAGRRRSGRAAEGHGSGAPLRRRWPAECWAEGQAGPG